MRLFRVFALSAVVCLAACSTVEERQARAERWWSSLTASMSSSVTATLSQPVEAAKSYVGDVVDGVLFFKQDVEERVDKVSEGLDRLREGKELIDEGLGRGEE